MIHILKAIISVFLSMMNVLLLPFIGHMNDYFQPKDPDAVKLNFATISDTHVTDSVIRQAMLELGLDDMQRSYARLDALVIDGDISDHGYSEQYARVEKAFAGYDPAERILPVIGNHDTWTVDVPSGGEYTAMENNFKGFVANMSGRELEKVYYSTTVNGYSFIMMGSEYDHTNAYISDTQLAWLDAELEAASQSGLPIFVFSHWPINQTHGLPQTWGKYDSLSTGGLGDQSDQVEAILTKYDNVFYITGHIHSGFSSAEEASFRGYASVESEGSFHKVNLPSYMYWSLRGYLFNGSGYQFEVYEDQVLIRARNYATGFWHPEYDVAVPLV